MQTTRLLFGAYQSAEISRSPLSEDPQWSMGGTKPRVVEVNLESAMSVPFRSDKLKLILTEDAQRDLINALQLNLSTKETTND